MRSVAQLHLTLCDSMDCSLLDSSVPGILQARILEWVSMPSSRGSSRPRDGTWISCRWILDHQATRKVLPGKPTKPSILICFIFVLLTSQYRKRLYKI